MCIEASIAMIGANIPAIAAGMLSMRIVDGFKESSRPDPVSDEGHRRFYDGGSVIAFMVAYGVVITYALEAFSSSICR